MSEFWEKQEKELARRLGGKRTPGSGAHGIKGDVVNETFMVEAKHRTSSNGKGSYLDLQCDWLLKITLEAKNDPRHRIPALHVNIGNHVSYFLTRLDAWIDYEDDCFGLRAQSGHCICGKQLRLFADVDVHDTYVSFADYDTGNWIFIREDIFYHIVRSKRLRNEEEKTEGESVCQEKTEKLGQRKEAIKARQKILRKRLLDLRKSLRKESKASKNNWTVS